jgi:hypothetical protein
MGLVVTVVSATVVTIIANPSGNGSFGIAYWLAYGVVYTIASTGFALLGRHRRMRRRKDRNEPGTWRPL